MKIFLIVLVVVSVSWALVRHIFSKQKKLRDEKSQLRRDALKEKTFGMPPAADVVEPQMGHPITPGVVPGWESRRQQQHQQEELEKILWRTHEATVEGGSQKNN